MAGSRTWAGLDYRPLTPPCPQALELFGFAGAWAPAADAIQAGWGAWDQGRLVAALLLDRAGGSAMLHGPVVVAPPEAAPDSILEAAAQLVVQALGYASSIGADTVFARPQALDRLWIRSGFIPVPEAELPGPFRGRPGLGLFGWRGGTALWSTAGRGAPRSVAGRSDR